jgi:hypothetical protein
MDNVQKHNICVNVQSSQTFRSDVLSVILINFGLYRLIAYPAVVTVGTDQVHIAQLKAMHFGGLSSGGRIILLDYRPENNVTFLGSDRRCSSICLNMSCETLCGR